MATTTQPTPKQVRNYLNHRGLICPMCKSRSISGGSFDVMDAVAWQEISCDECGFEWQDTYKLVGIADTEGNEIPAGPDHRQDSDCTIDNETLCCTECGVDHSDQCSDCGGRGFHKPACPILLGNRGAA